MDNQEDMAAPPWTKLRDLEYVSLQLEQDDPESDKDYMKWLKMLFDSGGLLGAARPQTSVLDENSHPWIAKFPSRRDEIKPPLRFSHDASWQKRWRCRGYRCQQFGL